MSTTTPLLTRRADGKARKAWPEPARTTHERVYRLCLNLLSSTEEAQEVSQTAMLQLHQSLERFRGLSAWSTWVYKVTLNAIRTFRRKRKYERGRMSGDDRQLDRVPDLKLPPPEAVCRTELEATVAAAMSQLSPVYREALILRQIEGLSYTEIAALCGVPMGTVKSRLHNGLVQLGKLLEGAVKGDPR